uniref:Type II toxin-antitoxin system RelE/ParE family toxin n=1 Tax=Schlesneria paludicola TaxID=360056 RepID=A0A7C2JY70_9PLAN
MNAVEYLVVIHGLAEQDVDTIYSWLGKRSRAGAVRWYAALLQSIDSLKVRPERCPLAQESKRLGVSIREQLFRTRRGRRYRLLFLIDQDTVRVLRIRGPGQESLRKSDLPDDAGRSPISHSRTWRRVVENSV